ncbi:Uncharacterized protein Adt_00445 [Abeliophyllum distichum]|uniref:Uncharacterized protein n=1 Tax=Abeliophyllum distichum TaxID=126358 RepID=A0ABD1VQE7_9LAMI
MICAARKERTKKKGLDRNHRRTDLAGSTVGATTQITDLRGRRRRRSKGVGAQISNLRAGRLSRSRAGGSARRRCAQISRCACARRSQIDLRVAPLVALRSVRWRR